VYPNGWFRYGTGIIAVGEPWGASYWYPVNEHPSDKATYRFRITVPDSYEAVSNGGLVEIVDHGDRVTYVWESRHAMASYLTLIAIARFDEIAAPHSGVPVVHSIQRSVDETARRHLDRTGAMIRFFSDVFGPYPFAPTVYWRGAMALHALREEIGDEAFFQVLREYVARHAGGNVTTADFVAVAEEIAERDLDDLFDAWLYAERTPPPPD